MFQRVFCLMAIMVLPCCAQVERKQTKPEIPQAVTCAGPYEVAIQFISPTESKRNSNSNGTEAAYQISLKGINPSHLSRYSEVRPYTGGKRIFVYFDTDDNQGAEYCLFVYQDEWTFRKATQPGFYGETVAEGINQQDKDITAIVIKKEWLPEKILKAWNFEMK